MTTGLSGRGDEPESGGRNISRDTEVARLRSLVAENADRFLLAHRSDEKIIQHQLGVVSADGRLMDGGLALREKPGQEERAFHLSTGDRQIVLRALQLYTVDFDGRGFVRSLGNDVRPHFAERLNHAIHRARGKGGAAHENAVEALACEKSA